MESDRQWGGRCDGTDLVGGPWKITGRTVIDGGALSLLRPHPHTKEQWWSVASRAARVRILSCSTLESVLVLQGSTDAICDAAEAIPDIDALYLQAKGYCPAGSPKCGPGALNGTQSGSWKAQTNDDWMAPIAAACKLSGAPSSCRPAKK